MSIVKTILSHWGAGDPNDRLALRHSYITHYSHVRHVVPKERLLEFESKDGWGPLCEFLGKPVPGEEYPRVNDAASTVRLHAFLYYYRIWLLAKRPLLGVGAAIALGWAVWLGYQRSGGL